MQKQNIAEMLLKRLLKNKKMEVISILSLSMKVRKI